MVGCRFLQWTQRACEIARTFPLPLQKNSEMAHWASETCGLAFKRTEVGSHKWGPELRVCDHDRGPLVVFEDPIECGAVEFVGDYIICRYMHGSTCSAGRRGSRRQEQRDSHLSLKAIETVSVWWSKGKVNTSMAMENSPACMHHSIISSRSRRQQAADW